MGAASRSLCSARGDTLPAVSFVAVAPEHPLIASLGPEAQRRAAEVAAAANSPAKNVRIGTTAANMSGASLGVSVLCPLTGARVPLYVAAYVLSDYGTGAIMGVPAHDERDAAFAVTHGIAQRPPIAESLLGPAAIAHTVARLQAGQCGEAAVQYRLRDWLVSRQRYWGAPIPMAHCDSCGVVPLPAHELPLRLPLVQVTGRGPSALAAATEWVGVGVRAATHGTIRGTMDTFVDSAWYFLRLAAR